MPPCFFLPSDSAKPLPQAAKVFCSLSELVDTYQLGIGWFLGFSKCLIPVERKHIWEEMVLNTVPKTQKATALTTRPWHLRFAPPCSILLLSDTSDSGRCEFSFQKGIVLAAELKENRQTNKARGRNKQMEKQLIWTMTPTTGRLLKWNTHVNGINRLARKLIKQTN